MTKSDEVPVYLRAIVERSGLTAPVLLVDDQVKKELFPHAVIPTPGCFEPPGRLLIISRAKGEIFFTVSDHLNISSCAPDFNQFRKRCKKFGIDLEEILVVGWFYPWFCPAVHGAKIKAWSGCHGTPTFGPRIENLVELTPLLQNALDCRIDWELSFHGDDLVGMYEVTRVCVS